MRKLIMLTAMALTLCATNKAGAQTFDVVNSEGDTIRYSVIYQDSGDRTRVEVVKRMDEEYNHVPYKGIINIPLEVVGTYQYNDSRSGGRRDTTITFSVVRIGAYAFENCDSLTGVTIPNSVSAISWYAFYNCTALTSVTIPASVTDVSYNVFEGCSGLTDIEIMNSVIGQEMFRNCTGLTEITIPTCVMDIGYKAFEGCSNLTNLSIHCPIITHSAFDGCTSLTTVTLGNTVTNIEYSAFRNCSSLTSIDIPNSVTIIGGRDSDGVWQGAFEGCSGLTTVTISASVDSIGGGTFKGCTLLDNIVCLAEEPPVLYGSDWFDSTPMDKILVVPCNSLETYKASTWCTCFSQDNIICETSDLEDANGDFDLVISLFPNPAEDFATLSFDNLTSNAKVVVFDIHGKAVVRQSVVAGSSNVELDLGNLPAGTYSVTITSQDGTTTRKLIKH